MNYRIREYIIDLAANGKTISYQELSNECQLGLDMSSPGDRSKIAGLLGDISTYEHNNNRPLITALVVAKGTTMQGDGFYKLAEQFGFGSWKILKRDLFDIQEIKRCFDFWKNKDNYTNHRNITHV